MAYRSKTFLQQSIDTGEILKDLGALKSLTDKQRRALADFWKLEGRLTKKEEALGDVLQRLLIEAGLSFDSFNRVHRLLLLFIGSFDAGDEPEVVFRDLTEAVAVGGPGGDREFSAYDFIKELLPTVKEACEESRRENAIRRAIPLLVGITYTCDVRMVCRRQFDTLMGKASEYTPEPLEWVPVGLMHLKTNADTELTFQIDFHRLQRLLEVFHALEVELNAARKTLLDAGLPARHQSGSEYAEASEENPPRGCVQTH
jgi:hypothetical protein